VHAFVVRALKDEPIHIHNEGDQIRSWCYIDDIVDAIVLALERDEAVGESFNIGNPRSTVTIYQLAQLILRLTQSKSTIDFVEWDFPDVELRIPDVKKAEQLLGFRASVELEQGLLDTIEWYERKLNGGA
jgi:nucleoside-diphosphate-sugar epimerase